MFKPVIRQVVWDIETMAVLSRVEQSYDGSWDLCKESEEEKAAQAKQQEFSRSLLTTYKSLGSEANNILEVLTPQLTEMATNPQGFGATEYAALQAKIINDTGAQYSSVAKEAARSFATSNEAGLPSGVEEQVQGTIAATAAGQVAGESSNLAIANEQLKQQEKEFAMTSLSGIASTLNSQSLTAAGTGASSTKAQFDEASTVYNQGSLWRNILGGVVGTGLNFLTGGLSSLAGGGGFLAGGSAAIGSGPH